MKRVTKWMGKTETSLLANPSHASRGGRRVGTLFLSLAVDGFELLQTRSVSGSKQSIYFPTSLDTSVCAATVVEQPTESPRSPKSPAKLPITPALCL